MIWAVVAIIVLLAIAFIAWVCSEIAPHIRSDQEIVGTIEHCDLPVDPPEAWTGLPPETKYYDIPEFLRPRLDPQAGMGNNEVLTDGRDS